MKRTMMWRTVQYFFSVYFMFLSQGDEANWGASGEGVTLPGDVILGERRFDCCREKNAMEL